MSHETAGAIEPVTDPPPAPDERRAAAIAHAMILIPGLGVFGALWIWGEGRKRSPFVGDHGTQAVAMQLSMAFLWIVEGFLYAALRVSTSFIFTWLGSVSADVEVSPWWFTLVSSLPGLSIALLFLVQLVAVIYGLFASHAANEGRLFHYALAGRWLKERQMRPRRQPEAASWARTEQ